MRVIAGEFKGRTLSAPQGRGTRPTTDRVKESLMGSLESLKGGFKDAFVLDPFAGSGSLGIEALSRGAKTCVFFEKDPAAFNLLKKNLAALGLDSNRALAYRADVLKSRRNVKNILFDILFLDPPYAYAPSKLLELCTFLESQGLLDQGSIIVYEHAKTSEDEVMRVFVRAAYRRVVHKQYGDTSIAMFTRSQEQETLIHKGATIV